MITHKKSHVDPSVQTLNDRYSFLTLTWIRHIKVERQEIQKSEHQC